MATKLTFKSETHYKDLCDNDETKSNTTIESYSEGISDNIEWRFQEFCRFLLGEGFTIELINKYINYDGEVFRFEEMEEN